MELVASNAVVVAKNFNPSILSQLWLARTEVVREDEFPDEGSIFVDGMTQVQTEAFDLLVVADRLQFSPKGDDRVQGRLLLERVGRLVNALPHTPYEAVGLNFVWHGSAGEGGLPASTRRLFFQASNPLHRRFDCDDAQFGAYMSKDVDNFRLKLDIKPVVVERQQVKFEDQLQVAVNFHRALSSEDVSGEVVAAIRFWPEAQRQATELAELVLAKGHE